MWERRSLTTLWAFTACYWDSFTFLPLDFNYVTILSGTYMLLASWITPYAVIVDRTGILLPHTLSVPGSAWVESTGISRASVRQVLVLELTTASFEEHNGSSGGLTRTPRPNQYSTDATQSGLPRK
jgi:hypothetical protein